MPARPELGVKDWHRLNRLLEEVLALEDGERSGWLAALPAADADLAPFLLKALGGQDAESLTPPALGPPVDAERAGDLIGPYRLLRELGKGGMGTVWLAERGDGAFERKVALKLPRAEWVDRGLARRFARERAVLAALDHSHIAQMLDAGQTASGRPYLALEYVDGMPIDTWCSRRNLGVAARLRLFEEVIRAVAHAHARLIVHRDLKPSNVMVTADGRSKLLDFGIAKLLAADTAAAEETELTRQVGRPLTPSYAAPEQVLGEPVSTATDIYTLGVMLFELLTGQRPYGFAKDEVVSRGTLEDRIVHSDVAQPSTCAADPALRRALRGDLDAIVLKALKKDPAQRYETAAAFADDIDRHLNNLPVVAQRDSRVYRWRRFIQRNRMAVGAGAAVVAALVVGFSVALWQARTARIEAAHSNTIKDFVLSLIQQADPMTSQQTRVADLGLLTTAEQRVSRELADRPALQLQIRLAIATAYRNRGNWEQARSVLRTAVSEAARRVPADDINFLHARILLGEWPLLDESELELDAVIERLRTLGAPATPALIDGLMARSSLSNGFFDRPLVDAREAVALAEQTFEPDHPKILAAKTALAYDYYAGWRAEEALGVIEPAYKRALQMKTLDAGHPTLLRAQEAYARRLAGLGRFGESIALLEQAADLARSRHGSDSLELAQALYELGSALALKREVRKASLAYRDAYDIVAVREPVGSMRRTQYMIDLTALLNAMERSRECVPMIGELLGSRTRAVPSVTQNKHRAAQSIVLKATLARALLNLGEVERARATAQQLLKDDLLAFMDQHYEPGLVVSTQAILARAMQLGGHNDEALADRVAQATRADVRLQSRTFMFWTVTEVKLSREKWSEALALAEEAVSGGPPVAAWLSVDAQAHRARGEALLRLGRSRDAVAELKEVDRFWRDFDRDHPLGAEAAWWFGQALLAAGDTARGSAVLADARPRLAASWLPRVRQLAVAAAPARQVASKVARD